MRKVFALCFAVLMTAIAIGCESKPTSRAVSTQTTTSSTTSGS
jgi:hypothetical protein